MVELEVEGWRVVNVTDVVNRVIKMVIAISIPK